MVERVAKFNPHHDPMSGRFTSGTGVDVGRDAAFKAKVKADGGDRTPADRSSLVGDLRTPDGGFTYDLGSNSKVTAGFAVSPYPNRSRVVDGIGGMDDRQIDSAVNSYIADNSDLLSKPRHYLGGWHDPATGKVYLDVSVVETSSGAAFRLGAANDQIAYFDLQSFESVDIDRNAKSGQAA